MAVYVSKTWVDAIVQYPTRYKILHSDASEEQVTMKNDFGVIDETGDVWDAATMNELEARIDAAFDTCIDTLGGTTDPTASQGKNGDLYIKTATVGNDTVIEQLFIKTGGAWIALPYAMPPIEITGTLAVGATTLTIQNAAITTTSTIDIYADVWGVTPENVVVTAGQIVITFEAQETALGVKVRVS